MSILTLFKKIDTVWRTCGVQLPGTESDAYRQDEAVNKVDDLEKEFDELMDTYGMKAISEHRVMIDTLDRIHDNALAGNIICECGDADIDLVLLSDCILLKCGRWAAAKDTGGKEQ